MSSSDLIMLKIITSDKSILLEFNSKKYLLSHFERESCPFKVHEDLWCNNEETQEMMGKFKTDYPYFSIGGTAAIGKTSFLKMINGLEIMPVKFTDYAEDVARNPMWKFKSRVPYLGIMYDHLCWSRAEPLTVFDRMPLEGYAYNIIFAEDFNVPANIWAQKYLTEFKNYPIATEIFDKWYSVFCCFKDDPEFLVERMKLRKNGIDENFPACYVERQNLIFREYGKQLPNCKVLELDNCRENTTVQLMEATIPILLKKLWVQPIPNYKWQVDTLKFFDLNRGKGLYDEPKGISISRLYSPGASDC